jgi:hypothetical protein
MPKSSAKRDRPNVGPPKDLAPKNLVTKDLVTKAVEDRAGARVSAIALEISLVGYGKPAQDIITAERAAKAIRLSVNTEAEVWLVNPDGTRTSIPVPDRKTSSMNPDELTTAIFKMQTERGQEITNLLIDVSELPDTPTMVFQGENTTMIGAGETIQEALVSAHDHVKLSTD